MIREIYLDNSATTRICPEALDKYREISLSVFGNPSSLHGLGFEAERVVKEARERILSTLGAAGCELVFTASGSEANNLAIIGRAMAKERYKRGGRIISCLGEHASVSEPLARLAADGFKVEYLTTKNGVIDEGELSRMLSDDVILVSVMMVNNETGAVYDLPRIGRAVRERCPNALFHVDATQGYLKIPFTKSAIGADMITLSSHKIEGPKGIGALVIDRAVIKNRGLSPLILGGGQEGGLRSGTENVPGIAAFATAAEIGRRELAARSAHTESLRSYLLERLSGTPELSEISPTLPRDHAPHIINLTLPKIKSETMLHYLSSKGVFVSSGSACSSNSGHLSSALLAFGRSSAEADCSIRVRFSHTNTKDDVDALCQELSSGLATLSRMK